MENPNFLKQKYDLHKTSEVAAAAERAEKRTGKKIPQNPEARPKLFGSVRKVSFR